MMTRWKSKAFPKDITRQVYHAINEYQLRLDVQRFLWPVYYIALIIFYYTGPLSCILGCNVGNVQERLIASTNDG